MDEYTQKLVSGDKDAFEKLVEDYKKRVYSLSVGMLSNKEDALDATQEIFLKIYRSLGSFKGDSSVSTWIFRIAKNVCIDFLRKRKAVFEDEIPETLADTKTPSPQEALELLQKRELVRSCIDKLPLSHKTVILLREYQQLSYAEIAKVLDLSEGTVKSRISRAREQLLKLLSAEKELF